MGSRSGIGSRGSDRDRGREKFAQAAANLYDAINKGDKASIAKATAQLSSHIAKMPTERLEAFAKSSSDAVWLTRRRIILKAPTTRRCTSTTLYCRNY